MSDRTQSTAAARRLTWTGAEPNAFSAHCIAYSGHPREAALLRKAGEVLMAGRGEAKLPEVEPVTAARVRAAALGSECGALADWCRNADLIGDLLAMEEPAAAYLYHLMERSGWRLRAIHEEIRTAVTDLDAKARAWAEGYRETTTGVGIYLEQLLALLEVQGALAELRVVALLPERDEEEDLPRTQEVAVAGLVDGAAEHIAAAVRELTTAWRVAEGLEAP